VKGVLVDTSVWIDYFNGIKSRETDLLDYYIRTDYPVCICPTILQEILQGFREDKDYSIVKESLLVFDMLDADPIDAAIGAADIYRKARKQSITIRKSNDCLIAYYATYHNVPILQKDRDFPMLSDICEIKLVSFD
jgi:hypothetical protein